VVSRISLVLGIFGLLFVVAGQDFPSQTQLATAYNQGRHLVLDPTTGWLHLVYAYGDDDDSPIYWSFSTDHGVTWSQKEEVGLGTSPCIVCEDDHVWVSYWHQTEKKAFAAIRASGTETPWTTYELCESNVQSAPSMAICHYLPFPNAVTGVYVVYQWFDANMASWVIRMNTVVLSIGVVDTQAVFAFAADHSLLYTPSVASTPGGEQGPEYVHVSWCVQPDPQNDQQLYYKLIIPPDGEEGPVRVTDLHPECEPAFNPSVEGYGDSVYVVWRAKEQGDPCGMVFRAQRTLEGPFWQPFLHVDLDDPSFNHSYTDCPQMSTRWAHVWHERKSTTANDVWANLFMQPPTVQLCDDLLQSMYPSSVAEFPTAAPEQFLALYTVWTNEIELGGPYKVKFQCDTFYPPTQDGFRGFAYYDAQVGDSVESRYCMARDGFKRWRDYSVDFGRDSLRYRLYYLNPNYDYRVMAVLFHIGRSIWEQGLAIDSVQVAKVRFRPEIPETVLVCIPRETYAKDFRADLDIRKLAGDYAVLADLKVFQCYPYQRKPGDPYEDAGLTSYNASAMRVVQSGPSPFSASTCVTYAVTEPCRVGVSVYDALGREVRHLASGSSGRGRYSVSWNALDGFGRKCPAGVYLIRFESDGLSQARWVVLTR